MTAIVTDFFKKKLINFLYDEVVNAADSNEYYIGIGKSDQYNAGDTVIDPIRSLREERVARANLQSVKKVTATSFVIPRYNWTSGTLYSGYSDSVVGIPSNTYYVLTEDNEVYICLQQGKNATGVAVTSTVQPSYTDAGVSQYQAFETADGYRWKFLYALSAARASDFLSAGFIPTQRIDWNEPGDSAGLNTFELQQVDIQRRAVAGQITSIAVTAGGSGYTSAPTVAINGNGSSAAATATISGGAVVKIEMNNESAAMGSGYDYASIALSGGGGTGATARPVVTSLAGIGADPREDLKSSSIMMTTKPNGSESGTFVIDNDFRQIAVLRNIKDTDSDTLFTATNGRALKYHQMSAPATTFTVDKFIRGASSGAAAYIDDIDSSVIYYHQNENTGFGSFSNGELLEESDGSGSGTITTAGLNSIVNPYSGEVLYIENRARIIRDAAQTEDIKVVITV